MNIFEGFIFNSAKAVWVEDKEEKNEWVSFTDTFNYASGEVKLNISCDTRYFLYVNGAAAVYDGGLFAPDTEHSYVDTVDITSFVKAGENQIEILVWHYGNGGRNNVRQPQGFVIYECKEVQLYSGENTECTRDGRFFESDSGEQPSYLYGGFNVCYNAQSSKGDYRKATLIKNNVTYYKRPTKNLVSSTVSKAEYVTCDNKHTVSLPYATHVLASFSVIAGGGEVIDIRANNYVTPGGPGDHYGRYNGHRCEYICKEGLNEFVNFDWFGCESIIFTIPDGVEILSLGYVENVYDTEIVGLMKTDDVLLNRLMEKCARTLKFCMRDNFMDCPDRERGQWIGDVSVQSHQVFYTLDANAILLLRKAIIDFITLRKGDRLVGNVPGETSSELPCQSLNAISRLGMISAYYRYTGDTDVLKLMFEPAVNYLKLWETDKQGLVLCRKGNWPWVDHLYNIDNRVCEICWYYSALLFALDAAEILGDTRFNAFLNERKNAIEESFNKNYWKGKYYSSGEVVDDRANALAVLVGLADAEKYIHIKDVLISVFNSSTYMEGYVVDALCKMGYKELGYKRLISRYYNLTVNENSTLWEDFYILGTKNHAWTGAPLTSIYRHFLGLEMDVKTNTITVNPDFSVIKKYECSVYFNGAVYKIYADERGVSVTKE